MTENTQGRGGEDPYAKTKNARISGIVWSPLFKSNSERAPTRVWSTFIAKCFFELPSGPAETVSLEITEEWRGTITCQIQQIDKENKAGSRTERRDGRKAKIVVKKEDLPVE
ncbi:hypothetical protein L3Y34_013740 [Caenorhabditis briggsae]|uniref:Uncharacterized protein n=1 Tax=Caenorhabditis briggsae TaxID=6238 RepID=A0AAE9CWZ8_CAEBR|nr:hypothetical protein L3Y34_013740 [Caenorhabditis briggsae]